MKKIVCLCSFLFFLIPSIGVFACEIFLFSDKEMYKQGDVAVIRMEVKWTHKNCIKEAVEPQLKLTGLDLLAKTKFKEKSSGLWEVKYKMKIMDKNAVVNAYEDCSKGGGSGSLRLNVGN